MTNNPNDGTNRNYDILIDSLQSELLARDIDIEELNQLKAPKADPTLTGTVKVPKNNDDSEAAVNKALLEEKLANKANQSDVIDAFVQVTGDISNINNALATKASNSDVTNTINTLNTSIQSSLNTKAPLASPTFTGTPKAPNPSSTSDATQIATKKYVDEAVQGGIPDISGKADKTYVDTQLSTKADTTAMNTQLALKANIASPTFTGEPKGPTPTSSSSFSALANKQYVDSAVINKVNITDMNTLLNLKANLASPALTGTPTAPTPTSSSGNTQIATKKYVDDLASTKAPTMSPTFVGTSNFSGTTNIAGTAFVASPADESKNSNEIANVRFIKHNYQMLSNYYAQFTIKESNADKYIILQPSDFGATHPAYLSDYFIVVPDGANVGYTRAIKNNNGTILVSWERQPLEDSGCIVVNIRMEPK